MKQIIQLSSKLHQHSLFEEGSSSMFIAFLVGNPASAICYQIMIYYNV